MEDSAGKGSAKDDTSTSPTRTKKSQGELARGSIPSASTSKTLLTSSKLKGLGCEIRI